jgi:C4-dicarboxylate-specific signal transduction histidine kinase
MPLWLSKRSFSWSPPLLKARGLSTPMSNRILESTLEKQLPAQRHSEDELREMNVELERHVAKRTAGLETANVELRQYVAERGGLRIN